MKKIIGIIVVLVIVAGAWYWWSMQDTTPTTEETATTVDTTMVQGEWVSADDELAVTIYGDDGAFVEQYDGEAVASGNWMVVESSEVEAAGYTVDADATYMAKVDEDMTLYYEVISVSETEMQLLYLDGGVLTFTRIN
tara:strand:+ start:653 stop:1066 length:414 start_codon:yes stop_codon:yes gene_type:complete